MDTYEKKYKGALNWMREMYPGLHGATKEDAEHYFPELRESEDEKTRKRLIDFISNIKTISESGRNSLAIRKDDAEMCDAFLLYLEKKKDHFRDDTKMIEQKPSFGIYWHKIKKGEKLPCRAYLWNLDYEKHYDWFEGRLIPNLENISVGGDTWYLPADDVRNLPREGVDELPREQNHAEKQDYSDLTDLERAIHRGFLSAGVENVPVTIIKETANECKRIANENANAEWSEEDKKVYSRLLNHYEGLTHCITTADRHQEIREELNFLKSLRYKLHWKPSEEQMMALADTLEDMPEHYKPKCTLESLKRDLEKLM